MIAKSRNQIDNNRKSIFLLHLLLLFIHQYVYCTAFVLTRTTNINEQTASSSSSSLRFRGSTYYTNSKDRRTYSNRHTFLKSGSEDTDEDDSSSSFDLESTRRKLELLVMGADSPNSDDRSSRMKAMGDVDIKELLSENKWDVNVDDIILPPTPPMTSTKREMKLIEIKAIKQLKDTDADKSAAATHVLWDIWFAEQGIEAKKRLEKTNELMNIPESWSKCENELIKMIEEYGIYFVEPVNRLATLYFLQGKYKLSYKLCMYILRLKPWHFGALSGIVGVCVQLGNVDKARYWATKRLPELYAGASSAAPFAGVNTDAVNPERVKWVDNAVDVACEYLELADKSTKDSFGQSDEYLYNTTNHGDDANDTATSKSATNNYNDDDPNAWQ